MLRKFSFATNSEWSSLMHPLLLIVPSSDLSAGTALLSENTVWHCEGPVLIQRDILIEMCVDNGAV